MSMGGWTIWAGLCLGAPAGPGPEVEAADGFAIEAYASHPLVSRPIAMGFGPGGRLWVATGEGYDPAYRDRPGEDRILVLEDRDGDGRADRTSIFAEGLSLPGGLLPAEGGAYVASGSQLLFLRDGDGDLRADQRQALLSGFGTESGHHSLHTLRRGPDGCIYMLQGESIRSEVDTPHGRVAMNGGGVWRYHPGTGRLEAHSAGRPTPGAWPSTAGGRCS